MFWQLNSVGSMECRLPTRPECIKMDLLYVFLNFVEFVSFMISSLFIRRYSGSLSVIQAKRKCYPPDLQHKVLLSMKKKNNVENVFSFSRRLCACEHRKINSILLLSFRMNGRTNDFFPVRSTLIQTNRISAQAPVVNCALASYRMKGHLRREVGMRAGELGSKEYQWCHPENELRAPAFCMRGILEISVSRFLQLNPLHSRIAPIVEVAFV